MVQIFRRIKEKFYRFLPGIISGGADNDPSGIATYAISGALFGYQQIWLLFLSTPMLIAVQAMCARLGDVTKQGLMRTIRHHYTPLVAFVASVILIITNVATLGADLAAIAEACALITGIPLWLWVLPLSALIWYLMVFSNFKRIERYLLCLTSVFIFYIISGFLSQPHWPSVLTSLFIPAVSFTSAFFVSGLALLGTTITPFLFFWQTKQEVEEHKSNTMRLAEAKKEDMIVAPGFLYSNLVSLFVIIATAQALHGNGGQEALTAVAAARALAPVAGSLSTYLFAFGIIGSGLLAIPILAASTAYVVAETFGWRDSLSDTVHQARGFYSVLTAAIVVGISIALSGVAPMQALLYSQVLNGILAPVLIVLILILCNNKKVMGTYVNTWFDNLFGSLAALAMSLGTVGLFWQLLVK